MSERTSSNTHSDSTNRKPRAGNPIAIPKTGKLTTADQVKSFVRKILLASPAFPRLYADVVIASAPNSYEAKILARNYKKIIERTSTPMPNPKSCTHIKVSGVRCGSPALRGEQFCYFHQRMLRTIPGPPASRVHHAALLEDEESIQASLIELVNSLLRGHIELKRAELILRALNTAVRNVRRVHFGLHAGDMVKEVPDYPPVPDVEMEHYVRNQAERQAIRAEFDRQRAAYFAEKAQAASVPAGTAAPVAPAGADASGRSPVAPQPPNPASNDVIARKPPRSAPAETPKERKHAAHRASAG
jgi:hypothetical protein